ncbi:MAG: 3'-5' exonuclease [Deltaproteobacteria bacterium]|nr:3'-5' exonuclease [Deltaproteobacteria bacterium]
MLQKYSIVPDIPDDLLKVYLEQSEIAVDTELQGLQLRRDNICLVQICDRNQQVCLIKPKAPNAPPNLKKLLESPKVLKVFHYALSDVAFMKTSLGITVSPFNCTKVMSKLARTYTEMHSLKHLVYELVGVELDKTSQTTNWNKDDLSADQLRYAANDVIYLLDVYDGLKEMLEQREELPGGITAVELNKQCQQALLAKIHLTVAGYGSRDSGWETNVFSH